MTNTELHYIILRASTIADLCIDAMFYWDFKAEAEKIPDRVVAIMELIKRDLSDAASAVERLEHLEMAKECLQHERG